MKENPTSRNLDFILSRVFLGVSNLRASAFSSRLRFSLLGLRDDISDREGVFGWSVLRWLLSFLVRSFPLESVRIREGNLGRKKRLCRSVQVRNLSNILWEEDILGPPQLGVYRDSCPIHRYSL